MYQSRFWIYLWIIKRQFNPQKWLFASLTKRIKDQQDCELLKSANGLFIICLWLKISKYILDLLVDPQNTEHLLSTKVVNLSLKEYLDKIIKD